MQTNYAQQKSSTKYILHPTLNIFYHLLLTNSHPFISFGLARLKPDTLCKLKGEFYYCYY